MRRKGQSSLPTSRPRGGVASAAHSPRGTSLLFSVNLRPPVETQRLPRTDQRRRLRGGRRCPIATGLMEIKLPNDLLVHGRKLAGILAEAREDRVVLGMGINVNIAAEDLPANVDRKPTSLLAELGETIDRARLLAAILSSSSSGTTNGSAQAEPGPDVSRHIFGEGIEAREGPAEHDGEDAGLPPEHRARDAVCDEGHTGRLRERDPQRPLVDDFQARLDTVDPHRQQLSDRPPSP